MINPRNSFLELYRRSNPMDVILPPSGDKGGLYLGNFDSAQNLPYLKSKNMCKTDITIKTDKILQFSHIGSILTISEIPLFFEESEVPYHMIIQEDDIPQTNLYKHFEEIYDFIDKSLRLTNVLVHCQAGVSRSSTAVIMYIMKKYGWSLERTLQFVRQKRQVVRPNPGFIQQLKDWDRKINGQSRQSSVDRSQGKRSSSQQNTYRDSGQQYFSQSDKKPQTPYKGYRHENQMCRPDIMQQSFRPGMPSYIHQQPYGNFMNFGQPTRMIPQQASYSFGRNFFAY